MEPLMEMIENYRKSQGLCCKEMAYRIGVSSSIYSRFKNGERKLTNNFKIRAFTRLKEIQADIARRL